MDTNQMTPSPADETGGSPDPALKVEIDYQERVNYALQRNHLPLIRGLRIQNLESSAFPASSLRLSVEPGFSEPVEIALDTIPPGGEWSTRVVNLVLREERLINLNERAGGRLDLTLLVAGEVRLSLTRPIEILAYNEWDGSLTFPEGLAAFSLPNHPSVDRILTRAATRLKELVGAAGLDGYDSGAGEPALTQARVIYAAMAELNLNYIRPPASFETTGQKIRTPDMVTGNSMGTCLDLALLYAACLEQAGLNPLILLLQEHALCGCWTLDYTSPNALVTEGAELRNRADLGELILAETTGLTTRPPISFQEALQSGRSSLDTAKDLIGVLDIRAARDRGILPLPLRIANTVYETAPQQEFNDNDTPTGELTQSPIPEPGEPETPATEDRLTRWKKRLLDLTLRNRLLNFRETVRTIRLHCPNPAALEDDLSGGASFTLHPDPLLMEKNDPRDPELHAARTGKDALASFLHEEIGRRRLHTCHEEQDLGKRLTNLYRAARSALEEGGANTLYLAVGFLHWYEEDDSTRKRRAPLLLLPLELHRLSAREGYRVRLADDDPQLNITLVRKLETDYRIRALPTEDLPTDQSGLDVPAILGQFRQAIKGMGRWEVKEEACIGLFSFTKFLMWRDLDLRLDLLHRNRVVSHLLDDPAEPLTGIADFPDPATLDENHPPLTTYGPLDADASQLAAVFAAEEGHDFVLQGPPGTGKSQTITNMIAQCLTQGKRVLFVAEKRAALEVVYRRLSQVGMDPFCLELHSNKAQKKETIAALGASLEQQRLTVPGQWTDQGNRLDELRRELNNLVTTLHGIGSCGLSFHQLVSRLVGLGEGLRVKLPPELWEQLERDALGEMREAMEVLAGSAVALGNPTVHPWRAVMTGEWSLALSREVPGLAGELEEAIRHLTATLEAAGLAIGGSDTVSFSRTDLEWLVGITNTLLNSPRPASATLQAEDWPTRHQQIAGWLRVGRSHRGLHEKLFSVYKEELLDLDLTGLKGQLEQADRSFWPFSWLRRRRVQKALQQVKRNQPAGTTMAPAVVLGEADALGKVNQELTRITPEAQQLLGEWWQGNQTDWDALEELLNWCDGFLALLPRATAPTALINMAVAGPTPDQKSVLTDWLEALREVESKCGVLTDQLNLDQLRAWGERDETGWPGRLLSVALAWQQNSGELRAWCIYRERAARAEELGLGPLLTAFESGACPAEELSLVLDRSILGPHTEHLMATREELRRFHGGEQGRRIESFRALDREVLTLTREAIRARLSERLPARTSNSSSANSEVGILQREVHKRSRHMPLRKLFTRIPNLLPLLKPCLLMSPLSVAQYLDAKLDHEEPYFDLVIFDEASQIPPWDAVGAIARGRQVVVVGDSKQLPPTNFFQRVDEDEPLADEVVEDLESILEECAAAGVPVTALAWHYRSRHESLIAFSNHHYYENGLNTFPSPCLESKRLGVSLRHLPQAVYDKGSSRTNLAEAEAVVAEIVHRLQDTVERNRTFGVVTFNQAQQTLIENLLDTARQDNPAIEASFSEEEGEPVFVKNLENVQGDERDVILFSICYGPDANGRLSMNFGPLNQKGGERRLNVAITRAREQVLVFSTIKAEQIDLSRTNAIGARHLREFLDYAARGTAALGVAANTEVTRVLGSPFVAEVHRVLTKAGHPVHSRVGCSGYRIDLGVVDPRAEGRYLLGIECDGDYYRQGRTARERDRLRHEVLTGLGWQLCRLWSMDWWIDRERETTELLHLIEGLLAQPLDSEPETMTAANPVVQEVTSPLVETATLPVHGDTITPYPVTPSDQGGTPEEFFKGQSNRTLRAIICKILAVEAPIHVELAARRLAACYGINRLTNRVSERFDTLLAGLDQERAPLRQDNFLWRTDQDPATWDHWRGVGEGGSRAREPHHLCPLEVANATTVVLQAGISLPRAELLKSTARLFGYTRMGNKVEEAMEAGLKILLNAGSGEEKEGAIVFRKS